MSDTKNHYFEVFYIGRQTGWVAVERDEEGNQVGDGMFSYHKGSALTDAITKAGPSRSVLVYNIHGALLKTLQPREEAA
jgi:hypothetical protein